MYTGINRNPPVRPNFNTAQPLRRNVQPVAPTFLPPPIRSSGRVTPIQRIRRNFSNLRIIDRFTSGIQATSSGPEPDQPIEVQKLQKIFTLGKIYENPTFCRLFSDTDNQDKDPNTNKKLQNHVTTDNTGKHSINFDPNVENKHGCEKMLELLKSGEITLHFDSLIGIWLSKMLELKGDHFLEFVTAVGLLDFRPYKVEGTKIILDEQVSNLTDKMEKIKDKYTLIYLGLCLHMLINDKPTSIVKKRYRVQEYLRRVLLGPRNKNYNEVMYSIVYDRDLQFFSTDGQRNHTVTIRCVFDIFRFFYLDQPRTSMNISSCYPLRWNRTKLQWFLWKNEFVVNFPLSRLIDRLTHGQRLRQQEAEQEKFDYMVGLFKKFSILDTLKKIYPDCETTPRFTQYFKQHLKIDTFNYDRLMKSYAEIMELNTWPPLSEDEENQS